MADKQEKKRKENGRKDKKPETAEQNGSPSQGEESPEKPAPKDFDSRFPIVVWRLW